MQLDGHQRVVPSPSLTLASDVPGAAPELALTCAPMATFSPEGSGGSVPGKAAFPVVAGWDGCAGGVPAGIALTGGTAVSWPAAPEPTR